MAYEVVHRVKEANGKERRVVTSCGKEVKWNPKDRLPDTLSVWHGDVTCEACRIL